MKTVILTAKANTWFKEGTEVYDYDTNYDEKKRVTLDYWNECLADGGICVRGIRICQLDYEQSLNCQLGEERIDGECCSCDEFNVEIVGE
jgi:hypothetical protein